MSRAATKVLIGALNREWNEETRDQFFCLGKGKQNYDLPPEKESSFMLDWKIRKGATDGQKILLTGTNH